MKIDQSVFFTFILTAAALVLVGCAAERTATNERLSEQSIGSATVGKKPGVKDRAHDYMMRR